MCYGVMAGEAMLLEGEVEHLRKQGEAFESDVGMQ